MAPPMFKPPPGVKVKGLQGDSYGPTLGVASGITLGFAIIAVFLRVFVKLSIIKEINVEDYMSMAALLFAIVRVIVISVSVGRYQFGYHVWDVISKSNFNNFYVLQKANVVFYLAAIFCAKTSILLLYIRLFGVRRQFRRFCFGMIAFVGAYCFVFICTYLFQCSPVAAGWSFFLPGRCINISQMNLAVGAMNILTDFIIVAMPIPIVLRLQLPLWKLVSVMTILGAGFFIVAVTIVREVQSVELLNQADFTWYGAMTEAWIDVEVNVGIICTCLPVLAPLGRKVPGKGYLRRHYSSLMTLLRTRSKSRSAGDLHADSESNLPVQQVTIHAEKTQSR